MFVWKRPKINEKEAGDGPFKKTIITLIDSATLMIGFRLRKYNLLENNDRVNFSIYHKVKLNIEELQ